MKKDYSKEIFEKYFNSENKILKITLNNGKVLTGIFTSFIHGTMDFNEPYILKWHFVAEKDILRHNNLPQIDFGEEYGEIINQSDIKNVTFKDQ